MLRLAQKELSDLPARYINTMLTQCWADVGDGEPALLQHWVNVSCVLGLPRRLKHFESPWV